MNESKCHLSEIKEFRGQLPLKQIEVIHSQEQYSLYLYKCPTCDRLYLGCQVKIYDDSWQFWIPAILTDIELVRINPQQAIALIQSRKHLVSSPLWQGEKIYWSEEKEYALEVLDNY